MRRSKLLGQRGFSMVEMLMAAFIMAIGILGLTMLQTMSIRAAGGSKGLSTAVLIAEQVMDRVESNGRNSLLYAQSTPSQAPTAAQTDVFTAASVLTFNFAGRPNVGDGIDTTAYFTVNITPDTDASNPGVVAPVPGLGGIANMTVVVRWSEDGAVAPRQVVLTRRVAYATA